MSSSIIVMNGVTVSTLPPSIATTAQTSLPIVTNTNLASSVQAFSLTQPTISPTATTAAASGPAGTNSGPSLLLGLGLGLGLGIPLLLTLATLIYVVTRNSSRKKSKPEASRPWRRQIHLPALPRMRLYGRVEKRNSLGTQLPSYSAVVGRADTIRTTSKAELAAGSVRGFDARASRAGTVRTVMSKAELPAGSVRAPSTTQ